MQLWKKYTDLLITAFLRFGATCQILIKSLTNGADTTVTMTELSSLANANSILSTEAGAGITGGTGTVYETSVRKVGSITTTEILLDLTGLGSSTTDLDIIGQGVAAAHLGQITAARNGSTNLTVQMTCLEAPAGGVTDIDLYSATQATGVFDGAIGDLTETAIITAGGAWANGTVKGGTAAVAADQYLYLTSGAAGTAGTYTAGKFLITLKSYD
jgi:hypothetical protein